MDQRTHNIIAFVSAGIAFCSVLSSGSLSIPLVMLALVNAGNAWIMKVMPGGAKESAGAPGTPGVSATALRATLVGSPLVLPPNLQR